MRDNEARLARCQNPLKVRFSARCGAAARWEFSPQRRSEVIRAGVGEIVEEPRVQVNLARALLPAGAERKGFKQ
jgi:hypothetical protein